MFPSRDSISVGNVSSANFRDLGLLLTPCPHPRVEDGPYPRVEESPHPRVETEGEIDSGERVGGRVNNPINISKVNKRHSRTNIINRTRIHRWIIDITRTPRTINSYIRMLEWHAS